MNAGETPEERVRRLIAASAAGDAKAADEWMPLVYDELRRLAQRELGHERPGRTLQPTALVHEAYLRLVKDAGPGFTGRAHFFSAAARAMKRILVEAARRRQRVKRGGDRAREELPDDLAASNPDADDLVALDEALARLEVRDGRKSEVVHLRYFAGLTLEETAAALGLSLSTVKDEWMFARAWLKRDLDGSRAGGA